MMTSVLHPVTERQLARYVVNPPHALLVSGAAGSGKETVVTQLLGQIMEIQSLDLRNHPFITFIAKDSSSSTIGIETVRSLEHFLSLKVPSGSAVSRAIVIQNADTLSVEAQNALLKTLEEPPRQTLIILMSANDTALLPTIRSRLQTLMVKRPPTETLQRYFSEQGHSAPVIARTLAMSGGLPGLSQALLENDQSHPLMVAAMTARELLQKPAFERLLMVDALAKDRQTAADVLFMLEQMAEAALHKANPSNLMRWGTILTTAFTARQALLKSSQPKLTLTNFMLAL